MFTGIIREMGRVAQAAPRLAVESSLGAKVGDSVAVDGACLTVVEAGGGRVAFDVVPETMAKTTLGLRRPGDRVNLEPPLAAGAELGGHFVQGHVDGVGTIERIDRSNGVVVRVAVDPALARYLAPKGSVAIDGISLTVVDADDRGFTVALIPFTLEQTTLGARCEGDRVNLETDVLAKYVARLIEARSAASPVDMDLLRRAGFVR